MRSSTPQSTGSSSEGSTAPVGTVIYSGSGPAEKRNMTRAVIVGVSVMAKSGPASVSSCNRGNAG
jgi:hypothetical protein